MRTSEPKMCFGACLVTLRKQKGLSQKSLALSAGMDQSYVAGLEAGRRAPPQDRQLLRLCQALHATEEEAQTLFLARTLFKLVRGVDQLDPQRAAAMREIASSLGSLSADQVEIVALLASSLAARTLSQGEMNMP